MFCNQKVNVKKKLTKSVGSLVLHHFGAAATLDTVAVKNKGAR